MSELFTTLVKLSPELKILQYLRWPQIPVRGFR